MFRTTVGGLQGVVLDVRVEPGARLPSCTFEGKPFALFMLYRSIPASLEHAVTAGMTMRLYLLSHRQGTLAVEVSDIDTAPGTLRSLSAVVRGFRFTQ